MFSRHQSDQFGKALPVQVSHRFAAESAVFDDEHLVSCAGLVPVMTLATQTGLPELLADKICIPAPKIKSGSANPSPKLATLIAGMCAGADSIDDLDVVRSGGMKTLFGGVYAPSTIGTLLREFTFGHARQLESACASTWRVCVSGWICCRALIQARSSISTHYYARFTVTPSRAPPTDTPRSPENKSCAKASHRWRPRSAHPAVPR